MDCKICDSPLAEHLSYCPVCKSDAGIPNIRLAQKEEEQKALEERYQDAVKSIIARKYQALFSKFEEAVKNSQAIVCRDLMVVNRIISSDNELYNNFHMQVDSGSRLPECNKWDQGRSSVDNSIFPNFAENICSAALSLCDRGIESYGAYNIILKEKIVSLSATVFEENPFSFMERHKVITGQPIPFGYRATWDERNKLAAAKLHGKLGENTTEKDFPSIILSPGSSPEDAEFIEVHIYGSIHRRAIKKIVGPKVNKKMRALKESVKRKLEEFGATFEEY